MSFRTVRSAVCGSFLAETVVPISRLQGVKGAVENIRRASRAMRDLNPALALLSAVEGLTDAIGIKRLMALTAGNQIAYRHELHAGFVHMDDAF